MAETKVTDSRLSDLIEFAMQDAVGVPVNNEYPTDILLCLRELQANRRGEFICSRCHLRKDGEKPSVEF